MLQKLVAVQGLEPFFATYRNYLKTLKILSRILHPHPSLCTKMCAQHVPRFAQPTIADFSDKV